MKNILLQPTVTAEWRAIVEEAEQYRSVTLGEDLQSYLVFLLSRYTDDPACVSTVLGLEFLECHHYSGEVQAVKLRDCADKCLIFSGLFPKQIERRRVSLGYVINLGQSAFDSLSQRQITQLSQLYAACRDGFLLMMDVMHAMRELNSGVPILDPLTAAAIEEEVNRGHPDLFLKRYTDSLLITPDNPHKKH